MDSFFSTFLSRDAVATIYQQIHSRELNADQAMEIVYSVKQSDEYFKSSLQSSELISPILQFYGAMALLRATSFLLSRDLRTASLSESHGLTVHEWKQTLSKKGISSIDELKIKIGDGFFSHFLKSIGNEDQTSIFTDPYPEMVKINKSEQTENLKGLVIANSDIWKNDFNTARIFRKINYTSDFQIGHIFSLGPGKQTDIFFLETTKEKLSTRFGYNPDELNPIDSYYRFEAIPSIMHRIVHKADSNWQSDLPSCVKTKDFRFVYFKPLFGGKFISEIGCMYLLLYSNCMLSRYFPKEWMQITHGYKGDAYYPIIKEIVKSTPERIISECFDLIQRKRITSLREQAASPPQK